MKSIMFWSFSKSPVRRLGNLVAAALLAVATLLGFAPASKAEPAAGSPPASPAVIMRALGISGVPAEIVILVDVSLSMGPGFNDLYPTVRKKVLAYLGVLARQDRQDLVGIILFGTPSQNQVTDPGPPNRHIFLPLAPYSEETDFGYAFQQAIQMLRGAPARIKVGSVLLLSDGELSVTEGSDPTYGTGFGGPGWAELRAQVRNLPIAVTGYDVPLTNNPVYAGNQYQALKHVFNPVQSLPFGTADLSDALNLATEETLAREVTGKVAADIGKGVVVTWRGLPGAGSKPLSLASGHAEVTMTVTSATSRVPLVLSKLSLTSTGLPVAMRATLPGSYRLNPGQSATWHVRLNWQSLRRHALTNFGTPRQLDASLDLHAMVSSPYTSTLRSVFDDTSFHVGGIEQGVSPQFPVDEPAYAIWLLLFLLLVAIAILYSPVAIRTWLSGTLRLIPEGYPPEQQETRLKEAPLRWWRMSVQLDEVIEKPGRMIVRRSLIRRQFRLRMRVPKREVFTGLLRPGKYTSLGGVKIIHSQRPRANGDRLGQAPPGTSLSSDQADGKPLGR